MQYATIIQQLSFNADTFRTLLENQSEAVYGWSPAPEKWRLLEIVCHLYDEERDDFRARVRHVLETPQLPMPPNDPVGWVTERRYMEQDYNGMVQKFLDARKDSVDWLLSLEHPAWDNIYHHPKLFSFHSLEV